MAGNATNGYDNTGGYHTRWYVALGGGGGGGEVRLGSCAYSVNQVPHGSGPGLKLLRCGRQGEADMHLETMGFSLSRLIGLAN